ncbi:MAG: DUF4333 domain-containing protein [Acidimicrobiales bacterium]
MTAASVGLLAVLGVVVAVVGACTSPSTLDRAATESVVRDAADQAIAPRVVQASCPGPLPAGEGRSFRCTARVAEVGDVRLAVTQVGGKGRLQVRPLDAVLADAAVARQLRAELRRRFGRAFQVTCGDHPWRIWQPGDTFPCRARDRDGRRSVDVTVEDAAGTLSFRVLRPGA